MKRLVCVVLLLSLLALPVCAEIDLSGLSYDELVALKDRINLAIWASAEWQEVTVPQGVWEVGVDIPAGYWTITAAEGVSVCVSWGTELNAAKTDVKISIGGIYESNYLYSSSYPYYTPGDDRLSVSWELKDGQYIVIDSGTAVFSPYSGKPSLGFK